MTRIYLKLTTPVFGLLLALMVIAPLFGAAQPPNPALRGFVEGCEDKPQPCWYGIVPAKTKTDEAKQVLESYGLAIAYESANEIIVADYLSNCSVVLTMQEPVINYFHVINITFSGCPFVRVGDLLLLWGNYERFTIGITFNEGSGTEISIGDANTPIWHTSPLEATNFFAIIPLHDLHREFRYPWHGFLPKWRYCQLEPDFTDCAT